MTDNKNENGIDNKEKQINSFKNKNLLEEQIDNLIKR